MGKKKLSRVRRVAGWIFLFLCGYFVSHLNDVYRGNQDAGRASGLYAAEQKVPPSQFLGHCGGCYIDKTSYGYVVTISHHSDFMKYRKPDSIKAGSQNTWLRYYSK